MENPKASAVARLKEANNVLVTVSTNPSVDQLAGAIGLTLLLNKLGKHATAVFSGDVPSTIEFLQPEQTLETNTDSLRDFIIALDKSKADKLRYKVEEKQVRIFITPYRTSLNESDLEFSHGDFNVDVVVALGVHEQQDLDQAIVAHGRILHDATILTINTQPNGSLGTISWVNEQSSSLCEMLTEIGVELKNDVLDSQMATALLTGIVAETERFSNQRTSSQTMSISAKLMAAGANQQLVATELQAHEGEIITEEVSAATGADENEDEDSGDESDDGSLRISHDQPDDGDQPPQSENVVEEESEQTQEEAPAEVEAEAETTDTEDTTENQDSTSRLITEPPTLVGGPLTANALPEDSGQSTDPLSLPPVEMPILSHDTPIVEPTPPTDYQIPPSPEPAAEPEAPVQPESAEPQVEEAPPALQDVLAQTGDAHAEAAEEPQTEAAPVASDEPSQTLADLEQAVDSPHVDHTPETSANADSTAEASADLDAARQAVSQAMAANPNQPLEPIQALGAQPVNLDLGHNDEIPQEETGNNEYLDVTKLDEQTGLPADNSHSMMPASPSITDAGPGQLPPPPPMPPPMMPPAMTYGEQPLPNSENDNQAQDPLAPL